MRAPRGSMRSTPAGFPPSHRSVRCSRCSAHRPRRGPGSASVPAMAFVPLVPIGDPLEKLVDDRTAAEQRTALGALEARLRDRRREVEAGWGPSYVERVHRKGKLTARERLARLADPGTRCYEVGTFVNYGELF